MVAIVAYSVCRLPACEAEALVEGAREIAALVEGAWEVDARSPGTLLPAVAAEQAALRSWSDSLRFVTEAKGTIQVKLTSSAE